MPPRSTGEQNHKATLSDADVAAIRAHAGSYQQRELAAMFGVSQSTIWRLIHGHVRHSSSEWERQDGHPPTDLSAHEGAQLSPSSPAPTRTSAIGEGHR